MDEANNLSLKPQACLVYLFVFLATFGSAQGSHLAVFRGTMSDQLGPAQEASTCLTCPAVIQASGFIRGTVLNFKLYSRHNFLTPGFIQVVFKVSHLKDITRVVIRVDKRQFVTSKINVVKSHVKKLV